MIPRTDIPFDAVPADDAGAASQTRLNSRQGAAFRRNTCSHRPYTPAPHAGGLRRPQTGSGGGGGGGVEGGD